MTNAEAKKLVQTIRPRTNRAGHKLKAKLSKGTYVPPLFLFEGGSSGATSIDVASSTRERVLAHWVGYLANNWVKNHPDCKYYLFEAPAHVARTEENAGDASVTKWTAQYMPLPAIGTRVNVCMNGFGQGTVQCYFVEHGWLGVQVRVDKQPEWHVKQNGRGCRNVLVFGPEVKPI